MRYDANKEFGLLILISTGGNSTYPKVAFRFAEHWFNQALCR
jgi:hypothetical protein